MNIKFSIMNARKIYDEFSLLFDIRDEDDLHYFTEIPNVSVDALREVLDEDLDVINTSTISVSEWARYKMDLLKTEKGWNLDVFEWKPRSTESAYPYIGVDIKWDNLPGDARVYFILHMALDNAWRGRELANVWRVVD